jgi:hypothetical protein
MKEFLRAQRRKNYFYPFSSKEEDPSIYKVQSLHPYESSLAASLSLTWGPITEWIISKRRKEPSLDLKVIAFLDSLWKCTPSFAAGSAQRDHSRKPFFSIL